MDFEHPPTDPVSACEQWFAEAGEQSGLPNPNAMALSTVSADGRPSIRMILLKGFDARGAVFYTNSESRKGIDLAACPRAALLFHWDSMERQIRIEGPEPHLQLARPVLIRVLGVNRVLQLTPEQLNPLLQ